MTAEQRLDAALAEWLDLRAKGRNEEPRAFAARHPDIEAELFELLSTMADLDALQGSAPAERTVSADGIDYEITALLGRGGMGEVHLGVDPATGDQVAIKVLTAPFAGDPERRARFEREVALGTRLRHDHIVAVRARGTWNGLPCLVMDYVPGIDLGQIIGHLRQQPPGSLQDCDLAAEVRQLLDLAEKPASTTAATHAPLNRMGYYGAIARLIATLADALQYAHDQGVIHRDVKPQNILIDRQLQPRLLDFGLAASKDDLSLSRSGDQIGTLHYMSPEMVRVGATHVDARTDVYSLGVTLYELLTLSLPFSGPSSPAVIRSIERDPTPWPRRRNPDIPPDLQGIVLRALGKQPQQRYASAGEMAADLRRFLAFERVQARTPGPLRCAGHWLQRHRRLVLAAAAAVVVALTGFTVTAAEREHRRGELLAAAERAVAAGQRFAAIRDLELANALRRDPVIERRIRHLLGDREVRLQGVPDGAQITIQRLVGRPGEVDEVVRTFIASAATTTFDLPGGDYRFGVRAGDRQAEPFVQVADDDPTLVPVELRPDATATAGMVLIAAGTAIVGQDEIQNLACLPKATITTPAFWLDAREVTNAEYAVFCAATGRARPLHWRGDQPPAAIADEPVTHVSWYDAVAYATFVGKRLPASVEYEIAARGTDGRLFPWGSELIDVDAAINPPRTVDHANPAPVARRTAANPGDDDAGGIVHLAGNVREWVADLYVLRDAPADPGRRLRPHGERVVRGGANTDVLEEYTCIVEQPHLPEMKPSNVGFRCARSAR